MRTPSRSTGSSHAPTTTPSSASPFLGHRMAGTGASYGIEDVTRIGRALEQTRALEDREERVKAIAALNRELREALDAAS